MNIVQFSASTSFGGMEKVFVELSNNLAEKHDVTAMILRGTSYRGRFSEKVTLLELDAHPTKHNPLLYLELYRKLSDLRPDIVHTHAAKATILAKHVCRVLGISQVGTKHNDRKGKVFDSLDWVVAVSAKVLDSIRVRAGAEAEIIHNGIKDIKVKPSCPDDDFTILAVGRLDRIKGFDRLIGAVSKLDFPFRLLIVGDGPEYGALRRLISDLKMENSVVLTGFRNDICQMMHDSDVVVMSSHREGFSNVIIEAIYCAPVLLSTPVGVAVEVLPAEFLVTQSELADKITELYQNYDQYVERFGLLRQEKKDLFQFTNTVSRYEAFYRRMMER